MSLATYEDKFTPLMLDGLDIIGSAWAKDSSAVSDLFERIIYSPDLSLFAEYFKLVRCEYDQQHRLIPRVLRESKLFQITSSLMTNSSPCFAVLPLAHNCDRSVDRAGDVSWIATEIIVPRIHLSHNPHSLGLHPFCAVSRGGLHFFCIIPFFERKIHSRDSPLRLWPNGPRGSDRRADRFR